MINVSLVDVVHASANCQQAYNPATDCKPIKSKLSTLAVVPITAYDADLGEAGELSYSIVDGNDQSGGVDRFAINNATGAIRLSRSLDFDTQAGHNLTVQVQDSSPPFNSASATLRLTVTDINDNTPTFDNTTYRVDVEENTPSGTTVISVTATDLDSTDNGRVTFSIVRIYCYNVTTRSLVIVSDSFLLVTAITPRPRHVAHIVLNEQVFDFESVTWYIIEVEARDHGTPWTSSTVNITVALVDLDDNFPVIELLTATTSHLEDEPGLIPTKLSSGVSITDADTVPMPPHLIQGARIVVSSSGSYSIQDEYLWLPDTAALYPDVCVEGNLTRELIIAGGMTAASYNQLLASIYYENKAREFAFNDTASVTIYITDELDEGADNVTACTMFDQTRNFSSVETNITLQERNDRPVLSTSVVQDGLQPLPELLEDPLSSQNIGRAVWQIFDGNVTDEDDTRDGEVGNAVFGAAVIGTRGSVGGSFQFSLLQTWTASLAGASGSGTLTLTMAYDGELSIAANIAWVSQPSSVEIRLQNMAGVSQATVTVTSSAGGAMTATVSFLPGNKLNLYGLLELNVLVVVVLPKDQLPLSQTLTRNQPGWVTIDGSQTSPMTATLVGPGSRLRFEPLPQQSGEAEATLMAWDLREGTHGTLVHNVLLTAGQQSSSFSADSATINITVLSVNDPPAIQLGGPGVLNYSTVYFENLNAVDIVDASRLTIVDVENDPIISVLITIYGENETTCDLQQECPGYVRTGVNFDRIQFTAYDLFELGFFNATGSICKTWNLTTYHADPTQRGTSSSNWQSYLRTAEFRNDHPEPYNHSRLIEFRGFDGKGYGPPAYALVNITTFNDNRPTVSTSPATFLEGNPCTSIALSLTANDPDCSATIRWANATIMAGETDQGSLGIIATSAFNLTVTAESTWVYIDGLAPVTEYERLLKTLVYYNNASEPNSQDRTLAIQIRGRLAESQSFSFQLTPELISDEPPVLGLSNTTKNFSVSFTEDSLTSIALTPEIDISDLDSVGNPTSYVPYSMRVYVENALDGTHEMLIPPNLAIANPTGTITITQQSSWSLNISSGSADLGTFISVASMIQYRNSAEQPKTRK